MEQKTRQKITELISEDANERFDWDKAMKLIVQLVCEVDALEEKLKQEREAFVAAYTDAQQTIARLSEDLYQYLGSVEKSGGSRHVKS